MPAQSINTNISTDGGVLIICWRCMGKEKIEQILKDEELECPSLGLSQD
jgi:hypothetical protein